MTFWFYLSSESVVTSGEDMDVWHTIGTTISRSNFCLATNYEDLWLADGEGGNITPWIEGVAGEFDQYPLRL